MEGGVGSQTHHLHPPGAPHTAPYPIPSALSQCSFFEVTSRTPTPQPLSCGPGPQHCSRPQQHMARVLGCPYAVSWSPGLSGQEMRSPSPGPHRFRPRAPFNTSAPLGRGGGAIFLRTFGQSKLSLVPSVPVSLGQRFSSSPLAPLRTQHHRGGGGGWAPRTRKRHQPEHRPQRPTERSDPTQHAEGRTGDCPGPP